MKAERKREAQRLANFAYHGDGSIRRPVQWKQTREFLTTNNKPHPRLFLTKDEAERSISKYVTYHPLKYREKLIAVKVTIEVCT